MKVQSKKILISQYNFFFKIMDFCPHQSSNHIHLDVSLSQGNNILYFHCCPVTAGINFSDILNKAKIK